MTGPCARCRHHYASRVHRERCLNVREPVAQFPGAWQFRGRPGTMAEALTIPCARCNTFAWRRVDEGLACGLCSARRVIAECLRILVAVS